MQAGDENGHETIDYCVPRVADCDYDHGCKKKFSTNRGDPFSAAESGSTALSVSRLPFPHLSSRLSRWRLKTM